MTTMWRSRVTPPTQRFFRFGSIELRRMELATRPAIIENLSEAARGRVILCGLKSERTYLLVRCYLYICRNILLSFRASLIMLGGISESSSFHSIRQTGLDFDLNSSGLRLQLESLLWQFFPHHIQLHY